MVEYHAPKNHLTFFVNVSKCNTVFTIASGDQENITIHKSESLTLTSYFVFECNKAPILVPRIHWSQLDCISKKTVKNVSNDQGVSATFAPKTFDYGCHLIRAQAIFPEGHLSNNTKSTYVAEKVVTVVAGKITAKIWGGISRTVGKNQGKIFFC